MNSKDKCEIVRDLSVLYFEKSINEESQKFVEEHLKDCEDCRKFYKTIESKICNEDEKDKLVTKQFKKIYNHISLLKIALITILVVILIATLILSSKVRTFSNIVNKSCEKIEYMKTLDNYKITVKTIKKDLQTGNSLEYSENYYYKDGILKVESEDSIFFYKDDSYNSVKVYHDLKQIDFCNNNFIQQKKGDAIILFSYIKDNYQRYSSTIYSLIFSVREDRYNGIDCYVIRFGNNNSYRDIWVDKDKFITIREVNEDSLSFYNERVFTFEENVVANDDIDITILESSEYTDYEKNYIENNITKKEFMDIFDSLQWQ